MNSVCITLQVLTIQSSNNRTSSLCCFSYTDVRSSHTYEQELTLTAFGRSREILSRCIEYDVVQVIGELWAVGSEWELVVKNCPGSLIPSDASCPINHITLIGNHGSDKYKDFKYFESGTALCKFGMACDRGKDNPTWFRVRAWGKTGEVAANYTRPGDRIGVEGTIALESYQGKQQLVIVANRLELLEPKPEQ
jgi:Single-strand binding protein family